MRAVLATYSAPKTLSLVAVCVTVAIPGLAYVAYAGPSPTYGWALHALIFTSGSVSVVFLSVLAYQVVVDRRSAIWINDNKIVHVSGWYQSVNAADVIEVSAGSDARYETPIVLLKLRGGRTISIRTGLLSEPAEEIAARLKEAVAVV